MVSPRIVLQCRACATLTPTIRLLGFVVAGLLEFSRDPCGEVSKAFASRCALLKFNVNGLSTSGSVRRTFVQELRSDLGLVLLRSQCAASRREDAEDMREGYIGIRCGWLFQH